MVVAGTYDPDSVPRPDNDYLKGKNSVKMTNFKEFVIRSDKGTREQFENLQSEWTHKGRAMDNKMHYMRFYMGFLSQMYIGGGNDGADGYSGARFLTQLES